MTVVQSRPDAVRRTIGTPDWHRSHSRICVARGSTAAYFGLYRKRIIRVGIFAS
jgi:hypothetical protein